MNTLKMLAIPLLFILICLQSCDYKENQSKAEPEQMVDNILEKSDGKIHIMHPDDGDLYWAFPKTKDTLGSGGELIIYMDSENFPDAGAGFAKYSLGVGGALPAHKHEKTEEIAYIISGEGLALNYVNEELIEIPIKAGYVWYNPPAIWHSIKNTGDEPLILVFAVIPNEKKGLLSFFRKIGVEPGKEGTVLSPEEFDILANEHDMILMPVKEIE
ncbi:MAG: cupin domain-containing protein [Bacteroidetes bacterium]|nr:cupin domain-containing protein [Bacteroidota bacterium]